MKLRSLKTGDYQVGKGDDVLFTAGIGSCVVVCLWDKAAQVGGMAHMLLPADDTHGADPRRSAGLSPDTAIPRLISMMEKVGASKLGMSARLVGAGNMFHFEQEGFMNRIGENILENTIQVLNLNQVKVTSMAVGGKQGRQVRFDVKTGEVEVKQTNGETGLI